VFAVKIFSGDFRCRFSFRLNCIWYVCQSMSMYAYRTTKAKSIDDDGSGGFLCCQTEQDEMKREWEREGGEKKPKEKKRRKREIKEELDRLKKQTHQRLKDDLITK